MLAIGLMSGTSLDGIDAALLQLRPSGEGYALELLDFKTTPFEPALSRALRSLLPPNDAGVAGVAALHRALGEAYAKAARAIAGSHAVDYVACHGQTVWHDGYRHVTLQLGDAFAIREAVGATVCYDFRSADCAAGGQGAPLVPYADALLLRSPDEARACLNVGGIANVTLLPVGVDRERIVAFDTGPGNMLLDALVSERTSGAQSFDRDGNYAAAGRVDDELLAALLADDYFAQTPPKTTGRERFGAQFLAKFAERLGRLSLADACATLAELTAASISGAIEACELQPKRVIVSGGGSHNRFLMRRLAGRLAPASVETSDAMGIPADAKEAIAFAILGYETLRGRHANLPSATGARHGAVLGAIAPSDLGTLLSRVEEECRA